MDLKDENKAHLQWSDNPQTLTDLLNENTLPIVAKVYTETLPAESGNPGSFDIYQPLLIYKEITRKKVYAKIVQDDVLLSARHEDDGHIIVVPTSYKGWFRLADDEDKPLTSIANIARIMPLKFLSSKLVSGYVYIREQGKSECFHHKVEIQPGVFYVKNIYEDFVRYTQGKIIKRKLLRCLECYLDDETEVLLPFDSQGLFYLIEVKPSTSKHVNIDNVAFVYNISDMITAGLTTDVVIQLVHGRPPKKSCGFTSKIKVCDLIKDKTIVACTLNKEKRLLELPLSPYPLFVKAHNDTELLISNQVFSQAVLYMEMVADNYANEMKVRYNYAVNNNTNKTEEVIVEEEEEEEEDVKPETEVDAKYNGFETASRDNTFGSADDVFEDESLDTEIETTKL